MGEPVEGAFESINARYQEDMGRVMRMTWTLRRPATSLDACAREVSFTRTMVELEIEINPQFLVSEPHITLIAGDRRFRVIEERGEDLDDGLFGERRPHEDAHHGR